MGSVLTKCTDVNALSLFDDVVMCLHLHDNHEFKNALKVMKNPQKARVADSGGGSLLHEAAIYGNNVITQHLISEGFDINLKNKEGETPLLISLNESYFDVAETLLKANADIWKCDKTGMNALDTIIAEGPRISNYHTYDDDWLEDYWEIMSIILKKVNDEYYPNNKKIAYILLQAKCPLTHVVFLNNLDVMKIMVEQGSLIEGPEDYYTRNTALHLAAHYWKLDHLKILLDYKVQRIKAAIEDEKTDVNLKCIYNAVLSEAVDHSNCALVEFLLSEGASLDLQNYFNQTPVHRVFKFRYHPKPIDIERRYKCIKIMFEYGANPEIRFAYDETILDAVLNISEPTLAEPILAHLAMLESLGLPISDVLLKQIYQFEDFEEYFDKRLNELEWAKCTIMFRSTTVFDFLTEKKDNTLSYARDLDVVDILKFAVDIFELDSYYVDIIRRRILKVLKVAEFRERVAKVLNKNIGDLWEENWIITQRIVDYLSNEDAKNLLGSKVSIAKSRDRHKRELMGTIPTGSHWIFSTNLRRPFY